MSYKTCQTFQGDKASPSAPVERGPEPMLRSWKIRAIHADNWILNLNCFMNLVFMRVHGHESGYIIAVIESYSLNKN
jgi:hypothetical protein